MQLPMDKLQVEMGMKSGVIIHSSAASSHAIAFPDGWIITAARVYVGNTSYPLLLGVSTAGGLNRTVSQKYTNGTSIVELAGGTDYTVDYQYIRPL